MAVVPKANAPKKAIEGLTIHAVERIEQAIAAVRGLQQRATMRIAVVSDIHGNLPALEAVLADIERSGVDLIVNLGDIVSGPLWPRETAAAADGARAADDPRQSRTSAAVRRHGAPGRVRPLRARSDAARPARLARGLPTALRLREDVVCCHGTPDSDRNYFLETVTADYAGPRAPGVRAATRGEAADRAGRLVAGAAHPLSVRPQRTCRARCGSTTGD